MMVRTAVSFCCMVFEFQVSNQRITLNGKLPISDLFIFLVLSSYWNFVAKMSICYCFYNCYLYFDIV